MLADIPQRSGTKHSIHHRMGQHICIRVAQQALSLIHISHKKNILDDRRIRLALSVLGAIVAWMVVTIIVQPGTSNTIYNVPVDYTYDSAAYTSRGLSIVSAEDKTVNLKISGDGYTIGSLTASDFVVYPEES